MKNFKEFLENYDVYLDLIERSKSEEEQAQKEVNRVGPVQITIDGIPWWMKGSFASLLLGPQQSREAIEMERRVGPVRDKRGIGIVQQGMKHGITPMPPVSDRDFEFYDNLPKKKKNKK